MTSKTVAQDVVDALHRRFDAPEWLTATEVSFNRGARRCDFMALRCWGDHRAVGVEVKVARSDWLRELDQPDKSQPFVDMSSVWYVAAPKGVLQLEELPAGWGYMQLTGAGNLRIKKRAEHRDVTWGRSVVAKFCARAVAQAALRARQQMLAEQEKEDRKPVEQLWRFRRLQAECETLRKRLLEAQLELQVAGVPHVGDGHLREEKLAAILAASDAAGSSVLPRMRTLRGRLRKLLEDFDRALSPDLEACLQSMEAAKKRLQELKGKP